MSKNVLGKGFDSLVPQGVNIDGVIAAKGDKVHHLALDIVRPRVDQPRKHFDELQLNQLAQSILEQGVLQPIIVAEDEHNLYTIIAGERRWRASRLAGLEAIPAIIKNVTELQHVELALLENVQRADLNAIETAKTIERLHGEFQQSYEDIAIRLGKAYTTVVNMTRLLQLPEHMQQSIMRGEVSEGHGRALLSLSKHPNAQEVLYKDIVTKNLSVRRAEDIAATAKRLAKVTKNNPKTPQAPSQLEGLLAKEYGVQVKVPKSTNKGKITFSYTTRQEYDRLIRRLQAK